MDLAQFSPEIRAVLEKYQVLRMVYHEAYSLDKKKLSTLLDQKVIERFLAADRTPGKQWLDWMLFQAGGGQKAMDASDKYIESRRKFFDKYEKEQPKFSAKKVAAGFSSDTAYLDDLWSRSGRAHYVYVLGICDEDSLRVTQRNLFGFYRYWPGEEPPRLGGLENPKDANRYPKIAEAVSEFTSNLSRIADYTRESGVKVSTRPNDYDSYVDLLNTSHAISRFFAAKIIRTDRCKKLIYEDDVLVMYAPLTYASAVEHGRPEWGWSDESSYEAYILGHRPQGTGWTDLGKSSKIIVYLEFYVPVPYSDSVPRAGTLERRNLRYLTLAMQASNMQNLNVEKHVLFTDTSHSQMRYSELVKKLTNEPNRTSGSDDLRLDVVDYKPAFSSVAAANEVIVHLDWALDALRKWAATFDASQLDYDPLKRYVSSSDSV